MLNKLVKFILKYILGIDVEEIKKELQPLQKIKPDPNQIQKLEDITSKLLLEIKNIKILSDIENLIKEELYQKKAANKKNQKLSHLISQLENTKKIFASISKERAASKSNRILSATDLIVNVCTANLAKFFKKKFVCTFSSIPKEPFWMPQCLELIHLKRQEIYHLWGFTLLGRELGCHLYTNVPGLELEILDLLGLKQSIPFFYGYEEMADQDLFAPFARWMEGFFGDLFALSVFGPGYAFSLLNCLKDKYSKEIKDVYSVESALSFVRMCIISNGLKVQGFNQIAQEIWTIYLKEREKPENIFLPSLSRDWISIPFELYEKFAGHIARKILKTPLQTLDGKALIKLYDLNLPKDYKIEFLSSPRQAAMAATIMAHKHPDKKTLIFNQLLDRLMPEMIVERVKEETKELQPLSSPLSLLKQKEELIEAVIIESAFLKRRGSRIS